MSQSIKKKPKIKKYFSGATQHNLLIFGRSEGLPSDDSEDSDYEPSTGETETPSIIIKKRKRGKKLSSSSQAVVKKSKTTNILSENTPSLDWSHRIPNELLHKVFIYAVNSSTAIPLLCRVSCVCKKWHAVASECSLWCSVDLSYMANTPRAKDQTLNLLRGKDFLNCVQDLNFTGWQKLTSAGIEVITSQCTQLRSLNLSNCTKIRANGVSLIAKSCRKLTKINLSYIQADGTGNMSIKNLLNECGQQLEELHLAGNKSVGLPSLLFIQSCCRNLKILDLSCTSIGNFNIERLQAGCPKMVELRLSQLSFSTTSKVTDNEMNASAGFPDLELLSLASLTGGPNDDFLQRLLKTSSKLRQLDLRGCEKITHETFSNIPAVSVEQLLLARCAISWKDLFQIIKARWKDDLKELDVSWCHDLNDVALLTLASSPNKLLTKLNLAGTGVSTLGVRNIIGSCPNLTELNLTSCRGVLRGLKQLHNEKNIRKLRSSTLLQDKPDIVELDTTTV